MLFSLGFAGFVSQSGRGDDAAVDMPESEPLDGAPDHIGSGELVATGLLPTEYAIVKSDGEKFCAVPRKSDGCVMGWIVDSI